MVLSASAEKNLSSCNNLFYSDILYFFVLQIYRGKLVEAEDNMNSQMQSVTVTYRDGRVAQLEHIYVRGSKIR